MFDQLDSDQPSQYPDSSPSLPEFGPRFPPPKRCRSDDLDDPAFFILFSGHDIIHRILTNPVSTPYQGAVAVPAAGTGGAAVSVSYRRFTQFLDRVGTKVGMSQENFTTDMRIQECSTGFRNTSSRTNWIVTPGTWGLSAYKVVQGFSLQKKGPFQ